MCVCVSSQTHPRLRFPTKSEPILFLSYTFWVIYIFLLFSCHPWFTLLSENDNILLIFWVHVRSVTSETLIAESVYICDLQLLGDITNFSREADYCQEVFTHTDQVCKYLLITREGVQVWSFETSIYYQYHAVHLKNIDQYSIPIWCCLFSKV